jgi:hypothetical protein
MAKYHSTPFKEGEIFFYPNLGALANFEDFTGKSLGEVFQNGKMPKLDLIYALLIECHKVACIRKSANPISLDELKTWVEGKEVINLFNDVLADLLLELGIGENTEQKKT